MPSTGPYHRSSVECRYSQHAQFRAVVQARHALQLVRAEVPAGHRGVRYVHRTALKITLAHTSVALPSQWYIFINVFFYFTNTIKTKTILISLQDCNL